MKRYFAPRAGFRDKRMQAICMDGGQCVSVHADGTETPCGYLSLGNVWKPTWTEPELEAMVKGGNWVEIPAPIRMTEAAPHTLPAPPTPVAHSETQAAAHDSD